MNERIKQLAKQATEEVMRDTPSFLATNEMWKEKFAQLIVQECANFVREEYDHEHAEGIAWTMEIEFGLHGDYA